MKSIILYFSGTGNTHFIAGKIYTLRKEQEEIEMLPYEQYDSAKLEGVERVYIGFPVYGLTLPPLLEEPFFRNLAGKEVYLFATMAYSAGVSLNRAVELAGKSGATVIGARTVQMPGSDGMGFMKADSPQIAKMLKLAQGDIPEMREIAEDLTAIDNGDYSYKERDFEQVKGLKKGVFIATSKVMAPLEKWMARKLHADENCTGCTLCEKICPTHNITVTGKEVHFGTDCTLCVRCVHHCPTEAINIGKMTKGKFKYSGPGSDRFKPMRLVKGSVTPK